MATVEAGTPRADVEPSPTATGPTRSPATMSDVRDLEPGRKWRPVTLLGHMDLPDEDGTFVMNFREHPQGIPVTESILPMQARDPLVAVVGRPALHGGGAAVEEALPPPRERGGGDAQLSGERIEVLAPEEAEDGLGLAPGRESAPILAVGRGARVAHLGHSFQEPSWLRGMSREIL